MGVRHGDKYQGIRDQPDRSCPPQNQTLSEEKLEAQKVTRIKDKKNFLLKRILADSWIKSRKKETLLPPEHRKNVLEK